MTPRYDSQYDNTGNGKVKGFDLFYKNTSSIKNLQYWISYSYTDSKRNEANYPATVTPPYVYKHSIYLVGKYWFASLRSQLSLTNSFVSGRNYNDPNQTVFMNGRTKGYNNLSMSWSFLYSQQKIILVPLRFMVISMQTDQIHRGFTIVDPSFQQPSDLFFWAISGQSVKTKKKINWTISKTQQLIAKICRFIQHYCYLTRLMTNFITVRYARNQLQQTLKYI